MIASPRKLSIAGCGVLLATLAACSGQSSTTTASPSNPSPTATQSHHSSGRPSNPPANPPATEFNPPGDIPDNAVFLDYKAPGSTVQIKVPEGWARSSAAGSTTFTDNYNSIALQVVKRSKAPSVTSAKSTDVPALKATVSQFSRGAVTEIQRQHGTAILITYFLDSKPNGVTGKVVRDAAERYDFWHNGEEAILTLTGPKGADNVDPWRLVSDSLQWK